MKISLLVISVLALALLCGCASTSIFSEKVEGEWEEKYRIETRGMGEPAVETPDGTKFKNNTKFEPFKDILNFQGIKT